jgi:small subunit ribosomal protein S17
VVSRAGDKTIVVEVTRRVPHAFYKRYVHKRKKFYAHDERNECRVGDWVRISESRPLSRQKRWRLREIVARGIAPLKTEAEPAAAAS